MQPGTLGNLATFSAGVSEAGRPLPRNPSRFARVFNSFMVFPFPFLNSSKIVLKPQNGAKAEKRKNRIRAHFGRQIRFLFDLQVEPGNGFEPPTCSLRMSRTTSCANLAWLKTSDSIHYYSSACKGDFELFLFYLFTFGAISATIYAQLFSDQ